MAAVPSEVKAYSLSNDDINAILDPDTKILSYPDFATMENIDQAFDQLGRCVFLFLTQSPTVGHWMCLFKRKGHIEYFDSYGGKPDSQRSWLSKEKLEELDEEEPLLIPLLKRSGYKVFYNTYPYQKDKDDINTCGRWVVARLILKDLDNLQFYNAVRQDMKERGLKSMDDWVAVFTGEILGK
jgi:hypothetical protein